MREWWSTLRSVKRCPRCGLNYPDEEARCFVDNAELESIADPNLGRTFGDRYQVEVAVGQGGMATVYRGRHTLVDRPVAIKVMSSKLARDPALVERFRREVKNTEKLAHPNIVGVVDSGRADNGDLWLVMELLEGQSLGERIEAGPLPTADALDIAAQIARGLARAHDFDVLHRDLKPDNIFLHRQGNERIVKLLDFGIARSLHDDRLTAAGQIFGTPQYMAPERLTSIDAAVPADLYAVGVILFEMVTGRLPFESEELTGYFIHHLKTPPPSPRALAPSCPAGLEALILQLLAKDPAQRPVDAHAVLRTLQSLGARTQSQPAAMPMARTMAAAAQAPTLPPASLERWAGRTVVLRKMIQRAFPAGPPESYSSALHRLETALQRAHGSRRDALTEQRALDSLESGAVERRERLGFAVQSLSEDLSRARDELRQAQLKVDDLLFQVRTLREQLGNVEEGYEKERAALEERLGQHAQTSSRAEQELLTIANHLVEPLRVRPELADLFRELEAKG